MEIFKENIILKINELKEKNELIIKFMKILLNDYEKHEEENNLNIIIQNIKYFEKVFKLIESENKVIYNKGNKYISFL